MGFCTWCMHHRKHSAKRCQPSTIFIPAQLRLRTKHKLFSKWNSDLGEKFANHGFSHLYSCYLNHNEGCKIANLNLLLISRYCRSRSEFNLWIRWPLRNSGACRRSNYELLLFNVDCWLVMKWLVLIYIWICNLHTLYARNFKQFFSCIPESSSGSIILFVILYQ